MCKFCEIYEQTKNIISDNSQPRPGRTGTTRVEFGAALTTDMYYNEYYNGRSTATKCELNFCPECGKRLSPEPQEKGTTCRQKAKKLLMDRMGVNQWEVESMVNLLEREGEYLPAVFGALNVPNTLDWDDEIPTDSETKPTV